MNPVMVVHNVIDANDKPLGRSCWVWCIGCNVAHRIAIADEAGNHEDVSWDWDGNMEHPTFDPSILTHTSPLDVCHSYIKNGQWQYLSDSTHSKAGQTLDMIPLPNWLVNEYDKEEE